MSLIEFECPKHGRFEKIRNINDNSIERCPECGELAQRVISRPAIVKVEHKENLPLGSGSRGKFLSHQETGGMGILIPSWGAMEKEEVEYTAEVALEKERERVAKNLTPVTEKRVKGKQKLESAFNIAMNTKQGQRAKALKESGLVEG